MCYFFIFVALVSTVPLPSTNADHRCEETETARVKLDLAKQSILNAKLLFPKCESEKIDSNCSEKDRSLAHLNAAVDLISEAKLMCHTCSEYKVIIPQKSFMDCSDIQTEGFTQSGAYKIWPRFGDVYSNKSIDVYCDMEIDGGGWTVIQRRGNFTNQIDFYQDWETFKNGFGHIKEHFWLGNEKIFSLTNQRNYSVRFDLVDVQKKYRYAVYDTFSIGDENSGYRLNIWKHSGNATDDMQYNDGCKFTTKDKQNDNRSLGDSCAKKYQSAFWYPQDCGRVTPNGIYQPDKDDHRGIWWYSWKKYVCLYSFEIKIRPKTPKL